MNPGPLMSCIKGAFFFTGPDDESEGVREVAITMYLFIRLSNFTVQRGLPDRAISRAVRSHVW